MPTRIRLHEKALAHLSRGLYRSPASAIRELVSNAWDANASTVRIDTNYPNFYQVAVTDDGDGFSKDEFDSLMGAIGNSEKRATSKPLVHGRSTIGRLGIGMLGIAQICGSFTVASKPAKGRPFRARVKLYDLLKQKLDVDDEAIVGETANVPYKDEQVSVKPVDVGEYSFESFDSDEAPRKGTQIIADDLHPTFIRSFQSSVNHSQFKKPPLEWAKAVRLVSRQETLQQLGDYWKLLWELSASCPVPYLSEDALPEGLVTDVQRKLLSYKFRLFVDGIQLFKPVMLEGNEAGYTVHRFSERKLVYGRKLSYHGYIAVQEGAQLRPDELRGILIRVRNVGIGGYDQTLLDYRINQGPRSRWLTGEVFVDEGLEDALNVDRDSFNKFHPEYRDVQEKVHAVLSKEIFPQVYKKIDDRSNKAGKKRAAERYATLAEVLSEALGKPVSVRVESAKEGKEGRPEVRILERKAGISVNLPNLGDVKTRKPYRQLAAATLAILEVAMKGRDGGGRRAKFTELLLRLLSRW
jgi:hypothetical protein